MIAAVRPSSSQSWLTPLFDPDTVWHTEAARAAMMAASADAADTRTVAIDALVQAIAGMLIEPVLLGRQLAAVVPIVKVNRVAAVLKETAAISLLHIWAVFEALDSFPCACDAVPADAHHLLRLMLESGTIVGKSLSEGATTKLKSVSGASKTAKLARQLVRLSGDKVGMQEVRTLACESVLARAERWRDLLP